MSDRPSYSQPTPRGTSHHPAAGKPPAGRGAILCAEFTALRGAAAFELQREPGRIQLFPAGSFAASDGRPGSMKGVFAKAWRMEKEDAEAVIGNWQSRKNRIVVDYEHQTLHAEQNGQPAPAAGWITDLVWEEGRGLFAEVAWTGRAREYIKAGEYRYISPVFQFDPQSGGVTRLHSAALTNNPALDGMMEARARENIATKDCPMKKEALAALAAFFGLAATATEDDVLAALKDKKPLADLLKEKDDAIAAAKEEPNPEKYVPAEMLKDANEKLAEATAKLAEAEKQGEVSALDAEITAALSDGRLPKSCEGWARNMAKKMPEAIKSYLDTAVKTAALTGLQTETVKPKENAAALTEDEKYVCKVTGVSEDDFRAQKAKESE